MSKQEIQHQCVSHALGALQVQKDEIYDVFSKNSKNVPGETNLNQIIRFSLNLDSKDPNILYLKATISRLLIEKDALISFYSSSISSLNREISGITKDDREVDFRSEIDQMKKHLDSMASILSEREIELLELRQNISYLSPDALHLGNNELQSNDSVIETKQTKIRNNNSQSESPHHNDQNSLMMTQRSQETADLSLSPSRQCKDLNSAQSITLEESAELPSLTIFKNENENLSIHSSSNSNVVTEHCNKTNLVGESEAIEALKLNVEYKASLFTDKENNQINQEYLISNPAQDELSPLPTSLISDFTNNTSTNSHEEETTINKTQENLNSSSNVSPSDRPLSTSKPLSFEELLAKAVSESDQTSNTAPTDPSKAARVALIRQQRQAARTSRLPPASPAISGKHPLSFPSANETATEKDAHSCESATASILKGNSPSISTVINKIETHPLYSSKRSSSAFSEASKPPIKPNNAANSLLHQSSTTMTAKSNLDKYGAAAVHRTSMQTPLASTTIMQNHAEGPSKTSTKAMSAKVPSRSSSCMTRAPTTTANSPACLPASRPPAILRPSISSGALSTPPSTIANPKKKILLAGSGTGGGRGGVSKPSAPPTPTLVVAPAVSRLRSTGASYIPRSSTRAKLSSTGGASNEASAPATINNNNNNNNSNNNNTGIPLQSPAQTSCITSHASHPLLMQLRQEQHNATTSFLMKNTSNNNNVGNQNTNSVTNAQVREAPRISYSSAVIGSSPPANSKLSSANRTPHAYSSPSETHTVAISEKTTSISSSFTSLAERRALFKNERLSLKKKTMMELGMNFGSSPSDDRYGPDTQNGYEAGMTEDENYLPRYFPSARGINQDNEDEEEDEDINGAGFKLETKVAAPRLTRSHIPHFSFKSNKKECESFAAELKTLSPREDLKKQEEFDQQSPPLMTRIERERLQGMQFDENDLNDQKHSSFEIEDKLQDLNATTAPGYYDSKTGLKPNSFCQLNMETNNENDWNSEENLEVEDTWSDESILKKVDSLGNYEAIHFGKGYAGD